MESVFDQVKADIKGADFVAAVKAQDADLLLALFALREQRNLAELGARLKKKMGAGKTLFDVCRSFFFMITNLAVLGLGRVCDMAD